MIQPLERDLGLTDSQFGTAATVFIVGYFVTAPFFGYLGDRMPRRWLIALGVAVWCAGTMLSGVASGFVSLLAYRILVGVGEASYGTLSPSWIADVYPAAKRNNALAIFYSAIPIGSAIGYLLGGAIAARYGWRMAFYVAGVPGLLLALGALAIAEPARGAAEASGAAVAPSPQAGGGVRQYAELFRIPSYRLVVAGYAAQTFALGAFSVWAPAFLQRVHHMTLASSNLFFGSAVAGTGLVATAIGGVWGTAWQKRSAGGYAGVLCVSAATAVPFCFAAFLLPNLRAAQAALVLAMFLIFLSTGPVNTLILETVPVARRASAMAASIFAIHFFGDLWSPQIVGSLSTRLHDLKTAILWTLPVAAAVCAAFWARLAWRQRGAPAAEKRTVLA